VQKNKVFIFIAVLHLGETGSLTKLNFNTCYPKKGIHTVAKPRRTPPPSFG
jgi:hypothetical protein